MSLRSSAVLALLTCCAGCGSDDGGGATGGSGGKATGGSGGTAAGGSATGGSATGGTGTGGTGTGGSATGGTTGTPGVRFVGRIDASEAGVTKMAWSGSSIRFRFSGTDASVRMDDSSFFFTVLVDGQLQPPLATQPGEQVYPVASGLADGEHSVELHRRTEASFGDTRFLGVELGSGTLLAPEPALSRRIEIIGDSITCGYGNEGADAFCNFTADTENHYKTYGAIAARNVGADLITVAWSGKGIVYNYGDDKTEPLPTLYDRITPYDTTTKWDFSWQPDVVIINLGTNDFSTDGDPPESEFVPAYQAFLAELRSVYPNAHILALHPTLLSGSDLTTATAFIDKAVAARKAGGDSKVEGWSMQFTSDGWGCDYHPSEKTHAAMGAALTAKLKSTLAW